MVLAAGGRRLDRPGSSVHQCAEQQQALTIYQRIGAPGAERIEETLRYHRMTPQPGN
jgi:hypothetical protein